MYAIYAKEKHGDSICFRFVKQVSLFGCKSGYVPEFLRRMLAADANEPHKWAIRIEEAMAEQVAPGQTLVINLKPRNQTPNVSLYELAHVFGHSAAGWSPIMLHLRGLLTDESPEQFDPSDFTIRQEDIQDPIFSLMYLAGTVEKGQLTGRWTPPGPSPTNSVLLWPDTLAYFWECAQGGGP